MTLAFFLWLAQAAPAPSKAAVEISYFVFLSGLTADVFIIYLLFMRRVRGEALPMRVNAVPWSVVDALAIYLFLFLVIDITFLGWWQFSRGSVDETDRTLRAALLGWTTLKAVVGTALLAVFLRVRHARLRDLFGGSLQPSAKSLALGLVAFAAVIPPVLLSMRFYEVLSRRFALPAERQEILTMMVTEQNPLLLGLIIGVTVIVAPVFEEIIFRGFVYPAVKTRFNVPVAILAVSAGFALQHWNAMAFLPLFVVGLGLAFAYEITGSLWTSIVMHAVFNSYFTYLALQSRW